MCLNQRAGHHYHQQIMHFSRSLYVFMLSPSEEPDATCPRVCVQITPGTEGHLWRSANGEIVRESE